MIEAPAAPADSARRHPLVRWIGPLVGVAIFIAAAIAVSVELRKVSWAQVETAAASTPLSALGLGLLALIASLLAASTFDGLALRSLGHNGDWRRTRITSVLAFALANVGPPGLAVAGGVRFRAYQDQGLSGSDIAVLSAMAAGVGLIGGLALLGLGAAGALVDIVTEAHLPHWVGLLVGAFGLKALATYLLAPRFGWLKPFLPTRQTRLAVVAASAAEWTAAATLFYVLLPGAGSPSLLHFLPVFAIAGLLGAASGLPGGIGPFDAVMIAVLGPRLGTAEVAGALILYRLIYVIGPLIAAGVLTAWLGARAHVTKRTSEIGEAVWREIAPPTFALLTFAAGVVTLLSAATPDAARRLSLLNALVPPGLVDLSHFVASLAGVLLLFLSFGLANRLRRAWWGGLLTLVAAAVLCLLKGLGVQEAVFLAGVALLLAVSRPAFHRQADLRTAALSPGGVAAIIAVLIAAGGLGLFAYEDVAYQDSLWWTFLVQQNAPRFLRAAVGAGALTLLLLAWRFTRPTQAAQRLAGEAELERAAHVLATAEDATPEAQLAFLGDKALMFTPGGSFVQYGQRGLVWIAMGEPVGPREDRNAAIWAFRDLCDRNGARPVFYSVRRESLGDFVDCGLVATKIGESAIVELDRFTLEGSDRAALRHVLNRGGRDGVTFDIVPSEGFDTIAGRLREISDAWLAHHHGVEKGFSLGRFDPAYLRRFPTAVLRQQGRIVAFANLWTTPDRRVLSIDLMRYGSDAPKNSMDLLFLHLIAWGRSEGYAAFDLGMAPLSGLDAHRLSSTATRLGQFVYAEGGGLYGFEGLRAFKQKFGPRWDSLYIAAPTGWMLGPALADAALLSSGGLLGALR
ncbi:bifunctional lysylphosphatidylglycerol flippase/synthetase MprF [Brevundimonas sp.]|uniref:bifunctional lysylphosphatidylglycerol flippase/synthetase MprF n=1 Tax=Brevundimonas sp. TaxID=1871086 RepID=UPI002730B234|nr:bifunctional lysylphosphatidylglycerol flippase/synthetase MprF [Brevundimonas sp.]MDP1912922.1 bifunctional lysylphosphatidylglycerol flippase/synthetase MprF [Brevundimonas sp.]